MTTSNVWMCGIPEVGGVESTYRCVPRSVTPEQTRHRKNPHHRAYDPADTNNGHRGSYWGLGMGCGEDWIDFNHLTKNKLQEDINKVSSGTGYRITRALFST